MSAFCLMSRCMIEILRFHYIDCFRALRAFFNIKTDCFTFSQRFKAVTLNGCMMNKNISSIFTGNKAVPLGIVEPFNCSVWHPLNLLARELKSQQTHKKATKLKVFVASRTKNF